MATRSPSASAARMEREKKRKEKEEKLKKTAQAAFQKGWLKPKTTPLDRIRELRYQGGLASELGERKGAAALLKRGNISVEDADKLLAALRDGMDDISTQLEGLEALKTACSYAGKLSTITYAYHQR